MHQCALILTIAFASVAQADVGNSFISFTATTPNFMSGKTIEGRGYSINYGNRYSEHGGYLVSFDYYDADGDFGSAYLNNVKYDVNSSIKSLGVSFGPSLYLTKKLSINSSFGLTLHKLKSTVYNNASQVGSVSEKARTIDVGLGINYAISDKLNLNIKYSRGSGETDVTYSSIKTEVFGIGVGYVF